MLSDENGFGGVPGCRSSMFNKTDTTCQEVNLGVVAYLGAV